VSVDQQNKIRILEPINYDDFKKDFEKKPPTFSTAGADLFFWPVLVSGVWTILTIHIEEQSAKFVLFDPAGIKRGKVLSNMEKQICNKFSLTSMGNGRLLSINKWENKDCQNNLVDSSICVLFYVEKCFEVFFI
jgi:hypothetical protein